MPKFRVQFDYAMTYEVEVEATTADEAKAKFFSQPHDLQTAKVIWSEMEDSVEVEAVN